MWTGWDVVEALHFYGGKRQILACWPGYSHNHIDMEAHENMGRNWRITRFYGQPNRSRRHLSWHLLRSLNESSSLPWCYMGDFNDIICNTEKMGGSAQPSSLIKGFCDALSDCNLQDLPLQGYPFTWERG